MKGTISDHFKSACDSDYSAVFDANTPTYVVVDEWQRIYQKRSTLAINQQTCRLLHKIM
jgi:hypothetical protein